MLHHTATRAIVPVVLVLALASGCAPGSPATSDPDERPPVHRGYLVWGHESRSFTPCGSELDYWVVDRTEGELVRAYDSLVSEPYLPLFVTLTGRVEPAPAEGFGAEYDGQLVVESLRRAVREGWGCEENVDRFEFRASGNEPFWNVVVAESGIVVNRMDAPGPLRLPYEPPVLADDGAKVFTTRSVVPPAELRLELEPGRCIDGMSGAWSDHRAIVSFDGTDASGCAYAGSLPLAGWPRYRIRRVDESMPGCGEDGSQPCTWFRFAYPQIESGLSEPVARAIDDSIEAFVRRPMRQDRPSADPSELVVRWNDAYRSFKDQFPDSAVPWTLRRTVSFLAGPRAVLNLELWEHAYTGGAHPNERVDYAVFERATGRRLALADVLVEDGLTTITRIGERKFREMRGLAPEDDLEEAGFWFADGRFALPERFAPTRSGLLFHWNAYEIAPYAVGSITLELVGPEVERELDPAYRPAPAE